MKKFFLIIVLNSFLFSQGEIHKGQTYYFYLMKDYIGMDGAEFAKQYSDKEWLALFDNNASELKKKLVSINQELNELLYSEKFNKIKPHLKAFVVQYASNKKQTPQCIE